MNVYLSQSVFDGQSNRTLRVLWGLRLEDTGSHYSRYSWWQMTSRSTLSDFLDRILLYTLETCSHLLVSKNIRDNCNCIVYFRIILKIRNDTSVKEQIKKTFVFLTKIFQMKNIELEHYEKCTYIHQDKVVSIYCFWVLLKCKELLFI